MTGGGFSSSDPSAPALLRGVDRAAFAVAFAQRLRQGGLPVGLSSIGSFGRALQECPPGSVVALYWLARVTLVHSPAELELFDAVFAAVFADATVGLDPHSRRKGSSRGGAGDEANVRLPGGSDPEGAEEGGGLPWATLPNATADEPDDALETAGEIPLRLPELLPSDLEAIADTPFDELDPAGLQLLADWLDGAVSRWPVRRSRRLKPHPRGRRLAWRRTMAGARATGFEAVELVHARAVERPRRLVMICDVSQSMQPYATAYLHLMRAATLAADAEVFAFGTRLTRLTPCLAHRSAEVAVELATERVSDRFGGTKIATNLRHLLSSRHGGSCRGAVVLVASDGWDSDPPEQLAAAMARLRRRAHRLIWINPRASAAGFSPDVGAMAAALPYCDSLLPAGTLRGLTEVVDAITAPPGGLPTGVNSKVSRGQRAGNARR